MPYAIPIDDRGYALALDGKVHTRHPGHGVGLRRTTTRGLYLVYPGLPLTPCPICYVPPRPAPKPRRPIPAVIVEPTDEDA